MVQDVTKQEQEEILPKEQGNHEIMPQEKDERIQDVGPEEDIIEKERQSEAQKEISIQEKDSKIQERETPLPSAAGPATAPAITGQYSQTYEALKSILNDNLQDYLVNLPEQKLRKIQKEQEKMLNKLEKMVDSFVIKTKDVLALIQKWLKMIPGINKFFLMQEAKIKTERIMEYTNRKQKEQLHS